MYLKVVINKILFMFVDVGDIDQTMQIFMFLRFSSFIFSSYLLFILQQS